MTAQLTQRIQSISPSATMAISARANTLKSQGKNIINLCAGEPDFDTPQHIKDAAIAAIHAGKTKYTQVDGTPELKQAIIGKLKRENNLTYQPNEILVSSGAKHSIYNLFQVTLDKNDEIIIPAPYWVSYPDMATLCGATPVIVNGEFNNGFKVSAKQLDNAITPNTKMLMLNSPSNPSGAVYSKQELQALGEVLKKHPKIIIASDDIYELISWTKEPVHNMAMACPELKERTLIINGVSKSYAMTGWRVGYAAGNKELIAAMKKLQSQSTSNPCSISQAAAVTALNGDQSVLKPMISSFKERHDYIISALNNLPGISCKPAEGAFYAFFDITKAMQQHNIKNDVDFTTWVLEQAEVAMAPGSAFGMPGFMRLSYAASMESLKKAIAQLTEIL